MPAIALQLPMFTGIRRVARAIFVDDLRLRRDERGLRIVLDDTPAGSETPVERALREAAERREKQLQDIRDQLSAHLATQTGVQQRLSHLILLARGFAEQGLAVVDTMPLAQLRTALEQFEATVIDWSPTGLAYLRSRMAVAVRERSAREGGDIGDTSALPQVTMIDGGGPDEEAAALMAAYGRAAAGAAPE